MRALVLCALILIAGCASKPLSSPHLIDNRWQEVNTRKQQACVMKIIEIAPPTATKEELDYNLKLCMFKNNLFIYIPPVGSSLALLH